MRAPATVRCLPFRATLLLWLLCPAAPVFRPAPLLAQGDSPFRERAVFHVKYLADRSVYLDAGRNAGLREGMKLSVVRPPPDGVASEGVRLRGYPHLAELNVIAVADSSAVCDVIASPGELDVGDLAYLTPASFEDRHLAESARETEEYPVLATFTGGDPLDSELRDSKTFPAAPSGVVPSLRGRFGLSYGGIEQAGMNSSQIGLMIDADMTHIAGTDWNFAGFWRGNLNSTSSNAAGTGTATLDDLINRTYTLGFRYENPYSMNEIGVGRVYLPWAPSLSTIDGGYYGRKIGRLVTVGAFAGSTPDPASWSYNPDQQIAGTFASVEYGDFDHLHFLGTAGLAVTSIGFRVARQFAFLENNLSWKRHLSLYNSMQIDAARRSPLPEGGSNPTGVSESYTSLHLQPLPWIGFGINHNFFRQLPTFDPLLIGTGLVDKYLFQGFSGDVRLDLPHHIALYTSLGQSKANTDSHNSLDQGYGVTFANIRGTGLLLDAHYSRFTSSFGSGQYQSLSVSKSVTDTVRLQVLGGTQKFDSPLSANTAARFLNGTVDYSFSRRYFLEGIFGWYQGTTLHYNQWSTVFGYRFGGLRR